MNEFDHFVKHELKVKHYARYTDDFVVVSNDQTYLQKLLPILTEFLDKKLLLNIHPNKISIRKYPSGIDFLGYIILPHCRLLRKRTWKRILRKFRAKVILCKNEQISAESLNQSLQSYLGMLSHADSRDQCEFLKNQKIFY